MYRKKNSSWLKHWDFELLDLACLEFGFLLAYIIRHWESSLYLPVLYLRLSIIMVILDFAVIFVTNCYNGILERNKTQELWSSISHVTVVQLLLLLYEFVMRESEEFSRIVFMMSWMFGVIFCFVGRAILKKIVRKRITSEKNQSRMLLITSADHIQSCVAGLFQKTWRNYKICAISVLNDGEHNDCIDANIPIMYGMAHMLEYIRTEVVDEVYIDEYTDRNELEGLTDLFLGMGITVHIGMGYLPEDLPNRTVDKMGDNYAVTSAMNAASSWKMAVKRFADILGGIVGVILTGLISIVLIPSIKITSPGPAFFTQERVGKNGRIFRMYKFRSMHVDAEAKLDELKKQNEMDGLMFKMENDPRIIGSEKGPGKGLGNFIRRTSLDEFPQFWNVLKGDMSLVGTRPPTVEEYERYTIRHKIRLSMKPGITGIWQVSGRNNIKKFEQVMEMDTSYIKNWSLILDIKILLKTVVVVLTRKGSH